LNIKKKKLSLVLFGLGYIGLALTVVLFADGVRRMYLILKVVKGIRRSEMYVFILFAFYVLAVSILFANIYFDIEIMADPNRLKPGDLLEKYLALDLSSAILLSVSILIVTFFVINMNKPKMT